MALSKEHRLKRRQDFQDVYKSGRRRSSSSLTLRALRQRQSPANTKEVKLRNSPKNKPATRFGISISQKVSKKAVVRNRIKRQLRAAIRHLLPNISPGWLVVVVVHPQANQCDYGQFLRELEQLLVEAEVINGHSRGSLL